MGNSCGTSRFKEEKCNPFTPKEGSLCRLKTSELKNIVKDNPFPEFEGKNIDDYYIVGSEIGRGEYGITKIISEISTGKKLACKSISKNKLGAAIEVEDIRREISILAHLPPHPNIVGLRGVFEDSKCVHILMDLCEGGELFEQMITKGVFDEKEAANIIKTIVEVLQVLHQNGIMHRDIKPENFLFLNKEKNSPLKVIDFGFSIKFYPGEMFHEIVGSPFYIAPEVLKRNYDFRADIWSAGVIAYVLLCGVPPFWGETDREVIRNVLNGRANFYRKPWPNVSASAKQLVKKMLNRNPESRPTLEQILAHPWMQRTHANPCAPLGSIVLFRIKQFSFMNQLRRKANRVIIDNFSTEEMCALADIFDAMDRSKCGAISFHEFKKCLKMIGSKMSEKEIEQLLNAIDMDANGRIDFKEFLSATCRNHKTVSRDQMKKVFDHFDKDKNGFIEANDLREEFGRHGKSNREKRDEDSDKNDNEHDNDNVKEKDNDEGEGEGEGEGDEESEDEEKDEKENGEKEEDDNEDEIFFIMKEGDRDNDGKISFSDFEHMMRKDEGEGEGGGGEGTSLEISTKLHDLSALSLLLKDELDRNWRRSSMEERTEKEKERAHCKKERDRKEGGEGESIKKEKEKENKRGNEKGMAMKRMQSF